ncbi:MAG: acetyl-CoA carboxylase carboxyltransferase subunit alpha [Planctomycetota bacterium]|nr:MAG: acetyl-CoA carboxylase carboxyltransferase subunit alpha [Planctomycetota bacterium]
MGFPACIKPLAGSSSVVSKPFDFLDPLLEIEHKIRELDQLASETGLGMDDEILSLRHKLEVMTRKTFDNLNAWQRVQLSRHPARPQTSDYIDHMVTDFVPLAGDRAFGDDEAIICGLGTIGQTKVMVVGQQKGKDVHERRRCNFGSPHPEGYRKAMHKMRLAERFGLPIVAFINTPGAFPGIGAEERGQSIAIAENIRDMSRLRVPVVCVVIGEGGSGGALGIGVGDRIITLENSYYSVISPEGCAAILWKDGGKAPLAAEALKLTSHALKDLGIVDEIVQEPAGGAHRAPETMAERLREVVLRHLHELQALPLEDLLEGRYQKFRTIGSWHENA